jgi:hypothetical protein
MYLDIPLFINMYLQIVARGLRQWSFLFFFVKSSFNK